MSGAPSARVLVCDDEPHIVRALKLILREAGYEVVQAGSVAEALEQAPLHPLDAAIVDLLLPDGDGVEICRALREWSEMPILLLSAVGDEDQKVRALEAGADDYVTKPFSPRELIARLQAVLRRTPAADEPVVTIEDLEIDLGRREVRRGGVEVHLSPIEFDLLRVLIRNRGRLLTHRVLLTEVWGHSYGEDVATLRTSIGRLRRKIEPPAGEGPRLIRTDLGVGYRFSR